MDTKMCIMCKIEKHINNFNKNYSECIDCNRAKGLKFTVKIKITDQINKQFIKKKIDKKLILPKLNNRCIQFRDLLVFYVELEKKLKPLEEKLKKRLKKISKYL